MNTNDVLNHFGVLGMHWGRRKASGGTTSEKKSQKPASEDYKISRQYKAKGSRQLSTKELRDLTQRLQLEKQLKDLNPTDYQKGLNFVKGLTAAGTTVASLYALSKTPLFQDVVKAVKGTAARA